ncbi:LysR family transcriptional regulator [Nannocystis sp.]|uniref:helix-turn-helix domain-containing protein n=1 Tax=Nannocystis sp. TaxID=1962667 RepID=UPI0025ECE0D9|nr:LysR family transcriptional regulator [Nannocystis sp.]
MTLPNARVYADRGHGPRRSRAFIAVVETGSFLSAATSLNVARATLRRRVDALEARAGVPLLERSARGVVVTEAGALLATRGRHVLQEASS